MQNAPIFSNFIKLPFVITIFVLTNFEWQLKTDFTVLLTFDCEIDKHIAKLHLTKSRKDAVLVGMVARDLDLHGIIFQLYPE